MPQVSLVQNVRQPATARVTIFTKYNKLSKIQSISATDIGMSSQISHGHPDREAESVRKNERCHSSHAPANTETQGLPSFAKLPRELQLMIWSFVPRQRIVMTIGSADFEEQRPAKGEAGENGGTQIVKVYRSTTLCNIPGTLHACRDSRAAALKLYTMDLSEDLGPQIYFDPTKDLVLFDGLRAFRSFCRGKSVARTAAKRFHFIAIRKRWHVKKDILGHLAYKMQRYLYRFVAARKLILEKVTAAKEYRPCEDVAYDKLTDWNQRRSNRFLRTYTPDEDVALKPLVVSLLSPKELKAIRVGLVELRDTEPERI